MDIGEPFALASYSAAVFASNAAGFVSTAANGDGVHVIDVADAHPVVSHTLGPKSVFTAPPISKIKDKVFTTLAGSDKTLSVWTEDTNSTIIERVNQKKTQVILEHQINGLYPTGSVLVVQSNDGHLSLLDDSLRVVNSLHTPGTLQKSYLFESCSFCSPTVLVSFTTTSLQIVSIRDDSLTLLANIPLPSQNPLSCSCSTSGFVSILSSGGTWSCFQLSPSFSLQNIPDTTLHLSSSALTLSSASVSLLPLNTSHILLASLSQSQNQIILLMWDLAFSVLLTSRTIPLPSSSPSTISLSLVDARGSSSSGNILFLLSPKNTKDKKSRSSILAIPISVPASSSVANALGKASAGCPWLSSSHNGTVQEGDDSRKKLLQTMQKWMESNQPAKARKTFFDWVQSQESQGEEMELGYNFVRDILLSVFGPASKYSPESREVVRWLIDRGVVSSFMLSSYGGLLTVLRSRGDWETILRVISSLSVPDLSETEVIETLSAVVTHHLQHQNTSDKNDDFPALSRFLSMILSPPLFPPAQSSSLLTPHWLHSSSSLRLALRSLAVSPTSSTTTSTTTSPKASQTHIASPSLLESLLPIFSILISWIRTHVSSGDPTTLIKMPTKKDITRDRSRGGVWVVKSRVSNDEAKAIPKDKIPLPPLNSILLFLTPLLDVSYVQLVSLPPSSFSSHSATGVGIGREFVKLLTTLQDELVPALLGNIDSTEVLRGALEGFARAQRRNEREGDAQVVAQREEGEELGGSGEGDSVDDGEGESSKKGGKEKGKRGKNNQGHEGGKGKDENWRQRRKIAHELEGMAVGLYRLEELVL